MGAGRSATLAMTLQEWWLVGVILGVALICAGILYAAAHLRGMMLSNSRSPRKPSAAASKSRASAWEISGRRAQTPMTDRNTPHEPGSDDMDEYDDHPPGDDGSGRGKHDRPGDLQ